MPLLFGSVGAAIRITEVQLMHILKGLAIFLFGVFFRFIATFLVGFAKKYTWKEKLFCAFAWLPKATVQAAIGGIILDQVRSDIPEGEVKDEYEDYGLLILTTSIISIVISAPVGAIFTNTFGPKLLVNDHDELGSKMKINSKTGSLRDPGTPNLKIRPINEI